MQWSVSSGSRLEAEDGIEKFKRFLVSVFEVGGEVEATEDDER